MTQDDDNSSYDEDDNSEDAEDTTTTKLPRLISVTFYRNNAEDIPIKLETKRDNDTGDAIIHVAAVYLTYLPIQVGDVLVSVSLNGEEWDNISDLFQFRQTKNKRMGVLTLRFENNEGDANVLQSFFVQPQTHTCLPMAINLQQRGSFLNIQRLEMTNLWISNSCLKEGHNIITINGTPCSLLEEEEAQKFLQAKLAIDPFLSVLTTIPIEAEEEEDDEKDNISIKYLSREKALLQEFLLQESSRNKSKGQQNLDRIGDFSTFSTSRKLFVAIQNSLNRVEDEEVFSLPLFCNEVLFEVFREYLLSLDKQLPRPSLKNVILGTFNMLLTSSSSIVADALKDNDKSPALERQQQEKSYDYRLPISEDVVRSCQIIATGEYCANQTQALQEDLETRECFSPTADKNKKKGIEDVSLTDPIEKFYEIIAKGMNIILSGLMNRLEEKAFTKMRSYFSQYYYWKVKDVVEESPYVQIICQEVQSYFRILTQEYLLPPCYLRSFCDKFVVSFCGTYYATCNRILMLQRNNNAEVGQAVPGIQQLLLDIYHLKEFCLLKLQYIKEAEVGEQKADSSTSHYAKLVQSECSKIEQLLKKD